MSDNKYLKDLCNMYMYTQNATTAITTPDSENTVTLETIMEAAKKVPPDPVREWMVSEGCDPDKGWVLVWPRDRPANWGRYGPPGYVMLSLLVASPLLMNKNLVEGGVPTMPGILKRKPNGN